MRIFLAQLNYTIGDFSSNVEKILSAIQKAKASDCDLVVTSELAICGYPPHDLLFYPDFIKEMDSALQTLIDKTKDISLMVGLARENTASGKGLFNSVAIISDQKLLGYLDKALLPTYDVFDECRYFEPASTSSLWKINGLNIAVTICEDIWQHSDELIGFSYHTDPVYELAALKPDLFINLSSSPFDFNKPNLRKSICEKVSITTNCPVVLCNQVGGNDSLIFDGYSLYLDANKNIFHQAKGFQEDTVIIDTNDSNSSPVPVFDLYKDLYQALVLGLRDYFHKSGFTTACLGLSGGIDSALVACIAKEALGSDNVLAVLMPSRYSSESSIADAMQLVHNLDIQHLQLSIESPFKAYLDLLKPIFEGEEPDFTEENLQARIRGMILMAISNKLGHINLSTGNKSELAMGYSTLYGDSCGGLAVISDLVKKQVYHLAKWLNQDQELIPQNILSKAPSAELRPNQKDTDSLPEYDIIDLILEDYIEGHQDCHFISEKHHFSYDLVKEMALKIHKAEYKRRQYPPGLRVTKKAFSIGRRFPIVQKWVF